MTAYSCPCTGSKIGWVGNSQCAQRSAVARLPHSSQANLAQLPPVIRRSFHQNRKVSIISLAMRNSSVDSTRFVYAWPILIPLFWSVTTIVSTRQLAATSAAPVGAKEASVSCSSDARHFNNTSFEEASSYDATSTTCSIPIATRRRSRSNTLASNTRNSKRHSYNLRARKTNTE